MTEGGTSTRLRRWLRFVIGGGLNTVITYGIYLALRTAVDYQWAYLIAFLCGILFSYWFNSRVVFRAPMNWRGLLAFPSVYLVQYVVSALLLGLLVELGVLNEVIAPLVVVVCTVPLTYVMSRWVIARSAR